MMRLLFISLSLQVSFGAVALTEHYTARFESGSHGDVVTTVNLAAGDDSSLAGEGSWSLSATTATNYFSISTNVVFNQTRPYTVNGVITNAIDTGTRGLAARYNTPGTDHWIVKSLGGEYEEFSGYVFVDQRIGVRIDGNNFAWDNILFENGSDYWVIQRIENSTTSYRSHASTGASVGSTTGSVPVGRHMIQFVGSVSGDSWKFRVFDADTRAQIGVETSMDGPANGPTTVKFSTDGHGGDLTVTNVWDNLVIVTNSTGYIFPWPTNHYWVSKSGNDSNSGLSPSYPKLTIDAAENLVTAGGVVHVGAGTYDERVVESTDGTSVNPITYVADGAVWVRGFQITGDYVRVIGFRVTHATDLGYAAFDSSNNIGVQFIDNIATNTSTLSSDFIPASHFITLRGNDFSWPGYPAGSFVRESKMMQDGSDSGDGSTNVLIEFNVFHETGDYINSSGTNWAVRHNRMGPTTTAYNGGVSHVDGWQANAMTRNSLYEAQWHEPNLVPDSHFFLTQDSANGNTSTEWLAIFNVSIDSGDDLLMEVDTMTKFLGAHNTFANVGASQGASTAPTTSIYFQNNSTGNALRNNIFTNVMTSNASIAQTDTGGAVTIGVNLTHPNTAGSIDGDPVFVDFAGFDLRIQTSSPAKDTGGALATTSGSGTGTTITLSSAADALYFNGTFDGMIRGRKVYVGDDNNLEVASRDLTAGTITLTTTITWANGENVGYAYRGSGPDVGAYEFGDTLLTEATLESDSSPFPVDTVTTDGDTLYVVFYVDGIPQEPDYDSPYTRTRTGDETVTAKAYALHAQRTAVFLASSGGEEPPEEPSGTGTAIIQGSFSITSGSFSIRPQ
jgi:hypothetical protein